MKMPNSEQMSQEQKEVYMNAPLDKIVLVTGPPGTGKTVIAFLRAQTIDAFKKKATVVMFGKVLAKYTNNVATGDYHVTNFHRWIGDWWKGIGLEKNDSTIPQEKKKVFLPSVPFEKKEIIKKLMQRSRASGWHKHHEMWFVWENIYEDNKELLEPWAKPKNSVPEIEKFIHDWEKIRSDLLEADGKYKNQINWGHLLIDEGQDFPPEMYKCFDMIIEIIFEGSSPDESPALTIFADDNQRLTETNSTIKQIKETISIIKDRHFNLTKNYRNTKQIAELAETFYVGLSTGIPEMPLTNGPIPKLYFGNFFADTVNYIKRYALNHENEEIGVITSTDTDRRKIVKELTKALKDNDNIKIQSYYSSKDPKSQNTKDLSFDIGGVITVINKQSCKGLEFDSVFLIELQNVSAADSNIQEFKMGMYVMCSRARTNLFLMVTNEGEGNPNILSYLPNENSKLLEYQYAE